ncbi:SDR family NAD(P)-dependent oxidoreductase [Candidatus Pacearchaeota archaeon]|nr:SDR family NAD(P)-dependent oxidoreductase [Candidatus Pacearchaeota archaeon]
MDFDFSAMSGKKALITGGCGFLGSNLARRLLELGVDVFIISRNGKSRENLKGVESKIKFLEGDLTDDSFVSESLEEKDYLFHLAWQTDLKKSMSNPQEDIKNDIIGLLNILESCRKKNPGIKVIFTSTVTVVGKTENLSPAEDSPENPVSVYELNKLIAEKYLKMYYSVYGINYCVLRLSNVFGEFQSIDNPSRGVLNFMIGRALRGEILTVYGKGDFIRDYSYVQNYVDAFILAAISEKTNGEFYVLGSGEGKTMNEVVDNIKKIVEDSSNKSVAITHVEFPGDESEINKRNFVADYSKFKTATGWFPKISFGDGLRKTIKFYLR